MNKMYHLGLMALISATSTLCAHAETVTIPWSAALQTNGDDTDCVPSAPNFFTSYAYECYLAFPLSVPIGHTIQQIAVIRITDNTYPGGQPFFEAFLDTTTLVPVFNETTKFIWTSSSQTPNGTFERHALMAQAGKIYPDQFQVAPYAEYNLMVGLMHGASIAAIEVTYN